MRQNKYDQQAFFSAYAKMQRSIKGLEAAGEWHLFKKMLPDLAGKAVLDLGCGYGWHCRYASEKGAHSVVGIDISEKMIAKAKELTDDSSITYEVTAIEDYPLKEQQFDVVISSLAFHYITSFPAICEKVYSCLKDGGKFVFSVEHPMFTARKEQDWHYNQDGKALHWPVDGYQNERQRETAFLGEAVVKYHRKFSTYINELIKAGFQIDQVEESYVTAETIAVDPNMAVENRRPMFLLVAANKVGVN